MRKIAHFLFCCASHLTSVKCDRAGFWRFSSLSFPLPSTCFLLFFGKPLVITPLA